MLHVGHEMEKITMYSDIVIKITLVFGSWFFAQVQPFAEFGISRGFDQLFTIGMMMLFIVYIIHENKKKDKKVDQGQEIYIELLKNNTEAFREFSESMTLVKQHMSESERIRRERFAKLYQDIEKIDTKLSDQN